MNFYSVILYFTVLSSVLLHPLHADQTGAIRLEPPEPGNLFLLGETPQFRVIIPKIQAAVDVGWRIVDWHGQPVSNGKARLLGGASLMLPKLPCGYYTVEFAPSTTGLAPLSFAVIAPPAATSAAEPPFALDTAFSWLTNQNTSSTSRPTASVDTAARFVRLSGAREVRERLSWSETNPTREQYVWNKYHQNAELLLKGGTRLLDVFHEAPPWTRKDLATLPRDLLALSKFAEAAARRLAPAATAWEFWNEPDSVSYCQDAAWDFASAQKAACYGFKLGNPRARVLSSAAAILPSSFFDVVLRNSDRASFDFFNLHLYEPVEKYQSLVEQTRRSLQDSGLGQFPIWVSEVGLAQEGSGKVPPLQSLSQSREHDRTQELEQALFLVKSLVTLASLGVERSFFFVLFPYNENNGAKVWGMLRWDWTPKPAYCAFSNLVHQLRGMHWSGRLDLGDGVDAFVWSAPAISSDQTVVLWSRARKNISLAGATSTSRRVDLMGSESALVFDEKGAIVEATAEPQFITHVSGLTSSAIWLAQKNETDAGINASSSIVLSLEAPAASIKNRIAVRIDQSVQWPLNVWNLSSHEQHIELQNRSRGVATRGLPERLTIGPLQKKNIQVEFAAEHVTGDNAQISFAGTTRNGKIAPVTIPLYPSRLSLQQRPRLKVDINDPRSWRPNSSGEMRASTAAKKDHISFAVTFPTEVADRWIYPELALASTRSAIITSSGVSFEIKQSTKESGLIKKAYLILVDEEGEKRFLPIDITPDWQEVTALWKYDAPFAFNPAKAVALQIGCNPTSNEFEYSVRNFQIIAAPTPAQ